MNTYIVVQDFNGHLIQAIRAYTSEEAKQIFITKTLRRGKFLEKIAKSTFEWNEIHVEQID